MEYFRKPPDICLFDAEMEKIIEPKAIGAFVEVQMKQIEKYVEKLGVILRQATLRDIEGIQTVMHKRFNKNSVKSFRDIYKAIRYGFCLVLEDKEGKVAGYDLSYCYADSFKTSNGMSMAIEEWLEGHRLGGYLESYSALGGIQRGMKIRSGGVHPQNFASVKNLLNKVGYICEAYYPDYLGKNEPRFIISFPLSPAGMKNNRIDVEKCIHFIKSHTQGIDYKLIECEDLKGIEKMYEQSEFRIVAFLPSFPEETKHTYLALPIDTLNFPDQDFL